MSIETYTYLDDADKKRKEVAGVLTSPGATSPNPAGLAQLDPETGQFHPSLIPGSEVCVIEASENLAANDLVNIWDDGGTFKVRKADASSYDTRAMGFVKESVTSGQDADVFGEGIVSGQTGLDPADEVFLSATTAGATTQTPPASSGDIWQAVGTPISATQFKFEKGEAICRA